MNAITPKVNNEALISKICSCLLTLSGANNEFGYFSFHGIVSSYVDIESNPIILKNRIIYLFKLNTLIINLSTYCKEGNLDPAINLFLSLEMNIENHKLHLNSLFSAYIKRNRFSEDDVFSLRDNLLHLLENLTLLAA